MNKNQPKKIQLPEHQSIHFDLHYITPHTRKKKTRSEKFHYMKKYMGEGAILDFYKKNSNILDL